MSGPAGDGGEVRAAETQGERRPAEAQGEPRPAEEGPSLQRLNPDLAAPPATEPARSPAPPVIDTRPYRWLVGIIGLAIVVGVSIYQFANHGVGGTGVTAGHPLRDFAAPLAATDLNGDANAHPTCSAAHHDPRALNVCLMARRGPLVLSFFVTGAGQCVRQVSALQTLAGRFRSVQFAAVAIGASHKETAALVRAHRWTIPVAYDADGRVGALYGVAACPMVEMTSRGGIVRSLLIGDPWQTPTALAPRVRQLAGGAPAG